MSSRQVMAIDTPACHAEVVLPHFWREYWELVWVTRLYPKSERRAKQTLERCECRPELQHCAGRSPKGLSRCSIQRAESTS